VIAKSQRTTITLHRSSGKRGEESAHHLDGPLGHNNHGEHPTVCDRTNGKTAAASLVMGDWGSIKQHER